MRLAVETGDYEDPQEFLRVALENQIELEVATSQEAKTLEEALASVDTDTHESVLYEEQATDLQQGSGRPSKPRTDGTVGKLGVDESSLALDRRQYGKLPTVSPPDESRLDDGPLWGQYNRIFPVKLVVRGLANEFLKAHEKNDGDVSWLALPRVHRRIAAVARDIGTDIAAQDELEGRTRGEKLSTGLPIGDDEEKSKDRFQTHFVGRVEHGDELTGAPPHLSLVDIASGSPQKIGLTDAGREFASLRNPLLDRGTEADQPLSREERRFYISHVREVRADEYTAMKKVAKAIAEGDDRPGALTERVAYINPEWSNSQAQTIRSGLTSRMFELGLLDRHRVGQRGIAYELTNEGEAFHTEGTAFAIEQRE